MTVFVDWAFKATGVGSAPGRTMPDRLSDIVNVKDWGALGNNSADDTAEIQAAINYAIGPRANGTTGGIVFFPAGVYLVSSPLTFGSDTDASVTLRGCGKYVTSISRNGSYTDPSSYGFTVSKGDPAFDFDTLARIEGIGGSAFNVKATRSGFTIEECLVDHSNTVGEPIACDVTGASGAFLRNCTGSGPISGAHAQPDDPSPVAGSPRGCEPGSICYALGSASTAMGCNAIGGYEIAYAISGEGCAVLGCRAETLGIAARVGWGPIGEAASYGCTIQGMQTERCMWGIELYNAAGCFLAGNFVSGGAGLPVPESVTLSWSGGTVTGTTGSAHNLAVGTSVLQFSTVPSAYIPSTTTAGIITVTRTGANTFTYTGVGSDPGTFVSATWTWPLEYALRCRKVYGSAIISSYHTSNAALGTVDLDYNGEAEALNNVIGAFRSTYGWIMPTDPGNLAGWAFIGGVGAQAGLSFPDSPNEVTPFGTMTYSQLPGESGVMQDGPYEGQEYNIIDGNSATFDTEQAGGGSGHYKVRYKTAGATGAGWYRVG